MSIDRAEGANRTNELGDKGGPRGVLELSKVSGRARLVQPLDGDEAHLYFAYFARAARKVEHHFARGELPDATCWAS